MMGAVHVIRPGDRGRHVVDVQRRLARLGYAVPAEERGAFERSTAEAVRAFQAARGIEVDGLVGPATWRELVEAGWQLGDRILYLRAPHFAGDDVRELQDRLATLGFDVGRIDGIFGPLTDRAVRDFQRNYGLPPDGVIGDETLRALSGLPRISGDTPASGVREREALRARPWSVAGLRVVLDPGHGGDDPGNEGAGGCEAALAFDTARAVESLLAASGAQVFLTRREQDNPTITDRAALANALGADLFVSLHAYAEPAGNGARAAYFGHARFASEGGARLAAALLADLSAIGVRDAGAEPKTFPVLRETRMTAVLLELGNVTDAEDARRLGSRESLASIAAAIADGVRRFTLVAAAV